MNVSITTQKQVGAGDDGFDNLVKVVNNYHALVARSLNEKLENGTAALFPTPPALVRRNEAALATPGEARVFDLDPDRQDGARQLVQIENSLYVVQTGMTPDGVMRIWSNVVGYKLPAEPMAAPQLGSL